MFKFWIKVFRGKVQFRQAALSCDSSYIISHHFSYAEKNLLCFYQLKAPSYCYYLPCTFIINFLDYRGRKKE